jgi:hypothetical protein
MDLRGRDVVIESPSGIARGPLVQVVVQFDNIVLHFAWLAIEISPGVWRDSGGMSIAWQLRHVQTMPVESDDGRIIFRVLRKDFGMGYIAPIGDNLSSSEVPGLDLVLEISEEVLIEDLPEIPDTTCDEDLKA